MTVEEVLATFTDWGALVEIVDVDDCVVAEQMPVAEMLDVLDYAVKHARVSLLELNDAEDGLNTIVLQEGKDHLGVTYAGNMVLRNVNPVALWMQLAEEATEVAHAALKVARILDGSNPTPCSLSEKENAVAREMDDLWNLVGILGIQLNEQYQEEKMQRWASRIEEARKHD